MLLLSAALILALPLQGSTTSFGPKVLPGGGQTGATVAVPGGGPAGPPPRGVAQGASLESTLPPDDDGSLGFDPSTQGPPLLKAQLVRPLQWKVDIERPGSGYKESFQILVPATIGSWGSPVLVGFHGYGQKASALMTATTFDAEAKQRGWWMIAPLGASKKHFGSLESQWNTEVVLAWISAMFPNSIDYSRIYGVGFSMGGGASLNFAARHLDPKGWMFAALVNHTGGVALKNTWQNDAPVRWILEYWYGGTPAQTPFRYEQCSLIDFDGGQNVVAGTDMARNLTHVPVRHTVGTNDPLTYLVNQTQVLHSHLGALGGQSELETVVTNVHSWDSLDAKAACDWLAPHSLSLPRAESTLADRNARWFHFDVTQDAPGSFTPFTWDLDAAPNSLVLSATENLAQLAVNTSSAGLDTSSSVTVVLSTADGLADVVRLDGYSLAPATVLRDGQPTASWSHDPNSDQVTLNETDGSTMHVWRVVP